MNVKAFPRQQMVSSYRLVYDEAFVLVSWVGKFAFLMVNLM